VTSRSGSAISTFQNDGRELACHRVQGIQGGDSCIYVIFIPRSKGAERTVGANRHHDDVMVTSGARLNGSPGTCARRTRGMSMTVWPGPRGSARKACFRQVLQFRSVLAPDRKGE
jgi:hypothetical protein